MIEQLRWVGVAALAIVGACDAGPPAQEQDGGGDTSTVELKPPRPAPVSDDPAPSPPPVRADLGRYSSIEPATCRLIEQNIEEGGYSRHACGGLAGYKLEISESDLRQDVVVIAPDGRRSELQLSSIVAKGAFNILGKNAEWRGSSYKPTALIVRLNVAQGPEPTRPEISNLVVARLGPSACVVAVVPPGADQNGRARQIADGKLPGCIAR